MSFISRKIIWCFLVCAILLLTAGIRCRAHEEDSPGEVGIFEKPGQTVPLDLAFLNEHGKRIILKDIIRKPTIVAPVYFGCRGECPRLLSGLSIALDQLSLTPGRDYEAITLSFDATDTPAAALEAKRNYLASFRGRFPEDSWIFLTGDQKNIAAFIDAVGFEVKKEKDSFIHSTALIVLSPEGKIIRYIYGSTFVPADLKMAILEASQERVGASAPQSSQICPTDDPQENRNLSKILKISAIVIIFFALLFILFLIVIGKSRARRQE